MDAKDEQCTGTRGRDETTLLEEGAVQALNIRSELVLCKPYITVIQESSRMRGAGKKSLK